MRSPVVKLQTASPFPGFLVSLDDFYLLGSGLMMTQTTNNVFNSSLFDTVTPSSLLAWQRVRLAHSLAHSGEEWAQTFSKYNSGEAPACSWPRARAISNPFSRCRRHVQQPVHGPGPQQSETGPQPGRRRPDGGGADPGPGGVFRPDPGSEER